MKENSSKQILLSVLGVAILVVAVVGVSFAAFTYTGTGTKENTISTGTISMTYSETSDGISLTNAMPMTDEAGKALKDADATTKNTFKFTVSATITGTTTIAYEISAVKKTVANPLPDNKVKLYLVSVAGATETPVMAPKVFTPLGAASSTGTPAGAMVLASGNITATQTTNYILKMWVANDYEVETTSKTFTVTVNVYAKTA